MGVAFGMSLLFYIEAKIWRFSISIFGDGVHFQFTTQPDVGECPHYSSVVLADLENVGVTFGIVLLSCIQAEIKHFKIRDSAILDFPLPVSSR